MLRSAGVVRSQPVVAGLASRDRILLTSCILLVAALAWIYLFRLAQQMSAVESMARMGMSIYAPWTIRDFALTFAMWSVMMIGMMTPTALPVLFLFMRMRAGRGSSHSPHAATMFAVGHVTIWIGFSAVAAFLQWMLHQAVLLSPDMAVTNSRLAGVILIGAGAYQLTPAKSKCLTNCQSPIGFLLTNWRDGLKGAFRLGLRHGVYCLGCCWALMLVLFVVGVMNLAWVALLTAFIFAEKFGPTGARLARVSGVAIVLAGIVSIAR
jgi:predicted metal-binding membrane protein